MLFSYFSNFLLLDNKKTLISKVYFLFSLSWLPVFWGLLTNIRKVVISVIILFLYLTSIQTYASISNSGQNLVSNKPILLILGDSLSAGYKISAEKNWPTLLNEQFMLLNQEHSLHGNEKKFIYPQIINGSISGDTAEQALKRLPELLKTYSPKFVLIEIGANNGMQGLDVTTLKNTLDEIVILSKENGALPILMQIDIPQNLGKRYVTLFKSVYPKVAQTHKIPLIPFYMTALVEANEKNNFTFIQEDGIHPTQEAQPFIVEWMMTHLVNTLLDLYTNK